MKRLARSMILTDEPLEEKARDPGRAPGAGYTYIGQFIVHDLTFDDTPFRSAGLREPEETINFRTPRLDLESLYGDGPGSVAHSHLYDGDYFRVGEDLSPLPQAIAPFDVPLFGGGPAVADDRNCENAIVRQVHAMFLLLHNLILRNLEERCPRRGHLFETARTYVRWHFQWLVRYDFLKKVCKKEVYEAVIGVAGRKKEVEPVIGRAGRLIHWPWGHFSVPVEFAQAAARFGHSMVKDEYHLRDPAMFPSSTGVPLSELLESALGKGALDPKFAIDWKFFLNSEPAEDIDTFLPVLFRKLPDANIDSFVTSRMPHEPHALAFRTLGRGAKTRLPTGQQLRVALDPRATISNNTGRAWDNLRSAGFENEIPLWYYLLMEAELNESGKRLGAIGSRIFAEVIEAALLHDTESFLHQEGGNWIPPKLRDADGTERTIESFSRLAIAVGLRK